MQLKQGQCQYFLGVEEVFLAKVVLNGALNDNPAYGELFPMQKIDISNMRRRYTEGADIYNPQTGTPQYWAYDADIFVVWPVPMNDFEAKVIVQPKNSLLRRVAANWFPQFWKGLEEI